MRNVEHNSQLLAEVIISKQEDNILTNVVINSTGKKITLLSNFKVKFIDLHKTPTKLCCRELTGSNNIITSYPVYHLSCTNACARRVFIYVMFCAICTILKTWKNPWRSVTFCKVAGFYPATLRKVTLLHGCFFTFFKLYKCHQIVQNITYMTTLKHFSL